MKTTEHVDAQLFFHVHCQIFFKPCDRVETVMASERHRGLSKGLGLRCTLTDGLSSYHLAAEAPLRVLPLIAGQAVVVGVLLDKVPGADGLLAAVAGEAVLMPAVALVLHLLGTWLQQRERNTRELLGGCNQLTDRTLSMGTY